MSIGCDRVWSSTRWRRVTLLALVLASHGQCVVAVGTGMPGGLPPGWSVHYHQGRAYFYNKETEETTWEAPRTAAAHLATQHDSKSQSDPRSTHQEQPASLADADSLRARPMREQQSYPRQERPRGAANERKPSNGGGWFGFGRKRAANQQQQYHIQGQADTTPHERKDLLRSKQESMRDGRRRDSAGRLMNDEAELAIWRTRRIDRHEAATQGTSRGSAGFPTYSTSPQRESFPVPDDPQSPVVRETEDGGGTAGGREAELWDPYAGMVYASPPHPESFDVEPNTAQIGGVREEAKYPPEGGQWPRSRIAEPAAGGAAVARDAWAANGEELLGRTDTVADGNHTAIDTRSTETSLSKGPEVADPSLHAPTDAADVKKAGGSDEDVVAQKVDGSDEVETIITDGELQGEPASPSFASSVQESMNEWFLPSVQEVEQKAKATGTAANGEAAAAGWINSTWSTESPTGDGAVVGGASMGQTAMQPDGQGGPTAAASPLGKTNGTQGPPGEKMPCSGLSADLGGMYSSAGNFYGLPPGQPEENDAHWSYGDYFQQPQGEQRQQPGADQKDLTMQGTGGGGSGWDWEDPWGQMDTWAGSGWAAGDAEPPSSSALDGGVESPTHGSHGNDAKTSSTSPAPYQLAGSVWGAEDVVGEGMWADGVVQEKESEAKRALAELQQELDAARKAEEEWRLALEEHQQAFNASMVEALAASEKAAKEANLAEEKLERERQYSSASIGMLLPLGKQLEEIESRLSAAETNRSALTADVAAVKEEAKEAEERAESAEAKLKEALEDVETLDDCLKQYIDGDGRSVGRPAAAALSWRRISEAYLRPLLPSKLKSPTPVELEVVKVNRSLARAMENNTALAEAVSSKDDLIKDLNSRIKQFQLHAIRRRKGYRALKLGLAELTDEVQAKENMMVILAVCMYGTYATLEGMSKALKAQQMDLAALTLLLREHEENAAAVTAELAGRESHATELQKSLRRAEGALSMVAASFGAQEDCVQRWKSGVVEGGADPEGALVDELHTAAARASLSPLGLEPTTGAITVAIPRTMSPSPNAANSVDQGGRDHNRKSFGARVVDFLCCRRGGGRT